MAFIEYQFKTANTDSNEILIALLSEAGFDSFYEDDDVLKAYIDETLDSATVVSDIIDTYPALANLPFEKSKLEDKNWNAEWESNFEPIFISDKAVIRASFHNIKRHFDYDIVIDPKMAFGTGHHATTRLMVGAMLDMDFKGKTVLDFGCGTGVLAILAKMMGAGKTIAIDNDEWAFNNTIENCETNGTPDIETIQGDQNNIPDMQFDIILANVNRNILNQSMQILSNHIKAEGTVLLSGLLSSHEDIIMSAANRAGLSFVDKKSENDWICINLAKK